MPVTTIRLILVRMRAGCDLFYDEGADNLGENEIGDGKNVEAELTPPNLWMAYVIPMTTFLLITYLEGAFSKYYIPLYVLKVCVVTALLIKYKDVWKDIRLDWKLIPVGVIVGLAVMAEWIYVDKHTPHFAFLGTRSALDPFTSLHNPMQLTLFLAARFYGLAIMVPVMEELFWRSFLLRYISNQDFTRLKIGEYSWIAFGVVALLFGMAHPEWLAAIFCAAAYALLLRYSKSLFTVIIAHGVTNLSLGIYVLITHDWRFW